MNEPINARAVEGETVQSFNNRTSEIAFTGKKPYHLQCPRMFCVNGWSLHPSSTAFSSISSHSGQHIVVVFYNLQCMNVLPRLSFQCGYYLIPEINSEIYFLNVLSTIADKAVGRVG